MKKSLNNNHLMVFMGSYIKNGKNYDYITYERNPKAHYRLYMDLRNRRVS